MSEPAKESPALPTRRARQEAPTRRDIPAVRQELLDEPVAKDESQIRRRDPRVEE